MDNLKSILIRIITSCLVLFQINLIFAQGQIIISGQINDAKKMSEGLPSNIDNIEISIYEDTSLIITTHSDQTGCYTAKIKLNFPQTISIKYKGSNYVPISIVISTENITKQRIIKDFKELPIDIGLLPKEKGMNYFLFNFPIALFQYDIQTDRFCSSTAYEYALNQGGNVYQITFENAKRDQEQEKLKIKQDEDKKRQKFIIITTLIILVIIILFTLLLYKRFKLTQKQKTIIEEKEQETQKQNDVIKTQKYLVEEKQKEITDSITYARRLQQAILTPIEYITKNFPNSFVLYKPKDILAGDFYWAEQIDDLFFIAAADCTGHGVPGAMVSVVCSNALNRTVNEFGITDTGKILDKVRELVIQTFEKSNVEVKDGMDISLLCIDSNNKNVFWSGANNPLWYIQNNELKEIKSNKQPIGKTDYPKPFTAHQIEYKENTTFYLFTDGFADQFGGPNGKKFKYKQFEEFLILINNETMLDQSSYIDKKFEEWKGTLEQVDDVCVIGIKI